MTPRQADIPGVDAGGPPAGLPSSGAPEDEWAPSEAADRERASRVARYRLVFDEAPVAYVTTDRRGRITEANRAAVALFEYPRPTGTRLALYVHRDERRAFREWVLAAGRGDGLERRTWRVVGRTGTVHAVRMRVADTPEELLWTLDRAEEAPAARTSDGATEIVAAFDELPYGMVLVDPATRRVLRANRRAVEIFGPLVGVALERRQRSADGAAALAIDRLPIKRALAGEVVPPERLRLEIGDGTERVLDLGALPVFGPGGAIVAIVATLDDVTDRHRREEADRAFIVNSAHQLRTPITAIASAVAALEAGAAQVEADRERFLAHIYRETERMTRLVEALMILARLERAGTRPTLSVVALAPLLHEVAAAGVARGAAIRAEVDDGVGAVTSEPLLYEVIANLVANAGEYAPAGEVTLRATLREEAEAVAIIDVSDTGPGVPRRDRELIFERFYRGAEHRTGAGLGLAVAAEATQAMGGTIELVDTPPGTGATFRLSLPGARIIS